MTQELPLRKKSEYMQHVPSEENGLVEDFGTQDPKMLLEREVDNGIEVDLGYFTEQQDVTSYGRDASF